MNAWNIHELCLNGVFSYYINMSDHVAYWQKNGINFLMLMCITAIWSEHQQIFNLIRGFQIIS
jgi:hypothetical protein